ncbi:hypothetical protein [Bradyrhizobium sp. ISRA464]|uniref:hypothetical protein n=1 Tax=Bradyrhizobium sp. ISRA464 TaxID=2866200 RepID=UPI00247976D4|nr:hypothetical protein [Bradyrhizobium sp. ISRA464]WGS25952.1 hypothetical protein MTX19_29830 [Bradyrhizobium sp. ISRA464]
MILRIKPSLANRARSSLKDGLRRFASPGAQLAVGFSRVELAGTSRARLCSADRPEDAVAASVVAEHARQPMLA